MLNEIIHQVVRQCQLLIIYTFGQNQLNELNNHFMFHQIPLNRMKINKKITYIGLLFALIYTSGCNNNSHIGTYVANFRENEDIVLDSLILYSNYTYYHSVYINGKKKFYSKS